MKLKSIDHLNYDPSSGSLSLKGQNSLGKKSTVEIPVESPAKLLSYLASAMMTHPEVQSGLYADRIDVVTTQMGDRFIVRLILYSLNMRLDFLIPHEFPTRQAADEQSSHLEKAFQTLLSPGKNLAN